MTTDMTDATSTAEKMTANLSVRANHALAANGLPLDTKALGMAPEEALLNVLTIGGKTGDELTCYLDACKMAYGRAESCPVHAEEELPPSALKSLTSTDVKALRKFLGDKLTPKSIMSHKDISGRASRMLETKKNPPFVEMFSKDVLNLTIDMATPCRQCSFLCLWLFII